MKAQFDGYFLIPIIIRLLYVLFSAGDTTKAKTVKKSSKHLKTGKEVSMFFGLWKRSVAKASLFQGNYIDARALYAWLFNEVPCIAFIGDLNVSMVFEYLKNHMAADIKDVYQYNHFDHEDRKLCFISTVFVLAHQRMIVLGPDYCEMVHNSNDYDWCKITVEAVATFRKAQQAPVQVIGFAVPAMN